MTPEGFLAVDIGIMTNVVTFCALWQYRVIALDTRIRQQVCGRSVENKGSMPGCSGGVWGCGGGARVLSIILMLHTECTIIHSFEERASVACGVACAESDYAIFASQK